MTYRMVRWNPVREMMAMQNVMDRMFDEAWSRNANTLALDVHESNEAYTVVANLPGLNPDSIEVSLHEGTLTISGGAEKVEPAEGTRVLLNERVVGHFTRSIKLPQHIDNENVEANYENGVLTLTLPKRPEAQPRQIPVRGNMLQGQN